MSEHKTVLLRLCGGYGLGDVVQHSVVLRHLAWYRPQWVVDCVSPRGMHSALHGLCRRSYHADETVDERYDSVMNLELWGAFDRSPDRPCNKTVWVLTRQFGLDYDPKLGRYQINVSAAAAAKARRYLETLAGEKGGRFPVVAVHYEGGSSRPQKDLQHWQAEAIVDFVRRAGRVPVVLDWHRRSPLPDGKSVFCPGAGHPLWGDVGNGDAEVLAALVRQCEAFVGIDSGPGKVASSTDTPSLVCWTKNHPLRFHDPAENTLHLVPRGWEGCSPADGDEAIAEYFFNHYRFWEYRGEHGLVSQSLLWLANAMNVNKEDAGVTFVIPPGVASACWALTKMRNVAAGRPADVLVAGSRYRDEDAASLPLLLSFPWVRSAKVADVPIHMGPERPRNTRGQLLFVSDGYRDGRHFLLPDAVVEQGRPLTDWLPEVPVDWETVKRLPEVPHLPRGGE